MAGKQKNHPKSMPKSAAKATGAGAAIKIICDNRKAKFDYHFEERFEAGLVLTGSEVKSLRAGHANLTNAYADVRGNEVFLLQAHIAPYDKGGYANHEATRRRKVLLHKAEIAKLVGKIQIKGMTLVPLKLYFKSSKAKVELALATGKQDHDKRAATKEREVNRDLRRVMKKG